MKKKYKIAHMKAAYVYAELSYCKRRKTGCIIVKGNTPIAVGYNGSPPGEPNCCEDEHNNTLPRIIHAEDNALRKLVRSHESATKAVMFVTMAPCILCAPRIVDAGIKTVYYNELYRLPDGIDYLRSHGIKVVQIDI